MPVIFSIFRIMATPSTPRKDSAEQRVRAANQRFYAAFESLDMGEMDAVWAHDENVECVQPGGELLLGWDEVRGSWARIFASTKRVRVALSSIWIRIEGDVGWVACTEHVTTAFTDGFDEAVIQATNIFIRVENDWLLVAHHASPLPPPTRSTVQ